MFNMGKYLSQPGIQIVPFQISLWLHIRIRNKKDKVKKKPVNKSEARIIVKRSADAKPRRGRKKQKGDKKKDKKKKKKRGRRIKIYVSNGEKNFVQMRMRVDNTGWNKIELPISQFPEVINANDSFKLCIKCKRCSKKVKIDLFKKPRPPTTRINNKPTIPFIHFENRSQLPQSLRSHRKRRSYDVTFDLHRRHQRNVSTSPQRHLSSKSCCHKEVFTDNIHAVFPRILYPKSIDITYCGTRENHVPVINDNSSIDNVTAVLDAHTNSHYKCKPSSMDDFTFAFLDNRYNIKHVIIEKLIPSSCECVPVQ